MAVNRGYRYFVDSKKYKKYILYMNKFISFASLALLASSTAFCDMMSDIVGDLTMPPPTDISQNFPYGITAKTPPYIQKILSKKGRAPYRMNLRIFQGCPTIESSKNGRLWAAYFGSNEQNEGNGMFSKKEKIFPYQPNDVAHAGQFTVIATSADGGKTWKEVGFPEKISVATKTVLFRAKSGNIILVGNDAKIVKIENDKPEFEEVRDINGKVVKPRGLRTCMTAFISYDDGKTFPKKILLDERFTSYPSICEHDGFLYISYDNSRTGYKHQEIMLAKITEADIEAGKLVNPESKLKMEISAPYKHGGGVRKDDKLL